MTPNQLKKVCVNLELGELIKPPQRIFGGLLHTMWQVDTNLGSYAIKQLSSDISDPKVIQNYNLTEQIAHQFARQGIPAIGAIGKLQIIDGIGFLIYPWVEAKTLGNDKISAPHALTIAAILAKMHHINLQIPKMTEPKFDLHSNAEIREAINTAEHFGCPFKDELRKNQTLLLNANNAFHKSLPILKQHFVVSHGDLDQKNVLWEEAGAPLLIDWESARALNPTYEIINASLDWSGITTNFKSDLFTKMINAYKTAGGIIEVSEMQSAFAGVAGNWINWLLYNLKRSCNALDAESKKLGEEQVYQTLKTIIRLEKLNVDL